MNDFCGQFDVIVIGAGPAGMAMSARMGKHGISHVVLEQGNRVAWRWQRHYRRLHLHTHKDYSELPGKAFPKDYPAYIGRSDLIRYFDGYAEVNRIRPRFGATVSRVERAGDHWRVLTDQEEFQGRHVVMATGKNNLLRGFKVKGLESFSGTLVHSRDYTSAADYNVGSALVIGAGNTGAELALDLSEHAIRTSLCVRSPTYVVPREFLGSSIQVTSIRLAKLPNGLRDALSNITIKLAMGNLEPWGITRPKMSIRKHMETTGRVPVIDIGTVAAIKAGNIKVVKGLESVEGKTVTFADGSNDEFDLIVVATGYKTGLEKLLATPENYIGKDGFPLADHFDDGLHFLGYRDMGLGILYMIGRVSGEILERVGGVKPSK
jgi:hypothetical protein